MTVSIQKEEISVQRLEPWAQNVERQTTEDGSQALNPNAVCNFDFKMLENQSPILSSLE